jgi:aspartyl/glutamyl-tRNA(Asn/Gln) amidotransferase C subunit
MTDLETLRSLAHLARLEFDPAREGQMLTDLNKILDWVAQLEKVDTEGVARSCTFRMKLTCCATTWPATQ